MLIVTSYQPTFVMMTDDCCGDPGHYSGPNRHAFKYGFCHEGMFGECCAPARGFMVAMTFPQWKYERDRHRSPSLLEEVVR